MPRRLCVVTALVAVLLPGSRCIADWQRTHDEGIAALDRGDLEAAKQLLVAAMAAADKEGAPHAYFDQSMMRLGRVQQRAGLFADAEAQYRSALTVREAKHGLTDPKIIDLLNDLATVCAAQEKYDEAAALTQRVLRIQWRELGQEHLEVGITLFRLATYAVEMGDTEKAESLLERSLPITNAALGNSVSVPRALERFGAAQLFGRHYQVAQKLYRRALALRTVDGDDSDPRVQSILVTLGFVNEQLGRWPEAEFDYQRAFAATRSDTVATRLWYVRARRGNGKAGDAALMEHVKLRRAGADPWATQIMRFLLRHSDQSTLLAAAAHHDPDAQASHLCEAYYFIGAMYELNGDAARASAAFQASVDTDVQSAMAFRSATASLDRIRDDVMITSVDEGAGRIPE